MSKRFTDTNKYRKQFIRGLPGAYKLLWDYLYHECDHAGIWQVDWDIAQICVGKDMPINEDEALSLFNKTEEKIVVLNGGSKWFIPSFVEFQYGDLNPENRAHLSVISLLKREGAYKGLKSTLLGAMDKDKDKDISFKSLNINKVFKEIIEYLNAKTGSSYKFNSKKTNSLIQARMNEGFTAEDFKAVINKKTLSWLTDPKMCKYLRPETLFSPKFEGYLNEKITLSQQGVMSEKTEKGLSALKRFAEGGKTNA